MGGAPLNLNLRPTPTGLIVAVRLTPKSARDAVEGLEDFDGQTVLKARVRALPEDGKANAALEKLIAKWLGLPQSAVDVVQGGKSRVKQVAISGNGVALSALLCTKLAEL
jgi:uncharacterized protein (TIGR00251 family)